MTRMICLPERLFSTQELNYHDQAVGCWLYFMAATSPQAQDGSFSTTMLDIGVCVGREVSYGSIFRLHKAGFLDYYTTPEDSPISRESVWHITMRSPGTHKEEEVNDGNA